MNGDRSLHGLDLKVKRTEACSLWDICCVTAKSRLSGSCSWYFSLQQPVSLRMSTLRKGFMSVSCGGVRAAVLQLGSRALLQFNAIPTIQAATK